LFLSIITSILFLGVKLTLCFTLVFRFFFLWTRGSFPRIRYDSLIALTWISLLPLRLLYGLIMF
jgi:NADH:ubiquinone oxidoreductase subunit H